MNKRRTTTRGWLAIILLIIMVWIFVSALTATPYAGGIGLDETNTPPPVPTEPPPTNTPPPVPTEVPTITATPGKVDPDLLTPQSYLPVVERDATPTAQAPASYP